jgi:hypothetical protein
MQYKSNVTLDCSESPSEVVFYQLKKTENSTEEIKVTPNDKFQINGNQLIISDLSKINFRFYLFVLLFFFDDRLLQDEKK